MQYYFEIYLLHNDLTKEHWQMLYNAILQFGGNLEKFDLTFTCKDNVVRFFVASNKDLSVLSNNLEGIVLRPATEDDVKAPSHVSKERFVQLHTGGNILDLKEKYQVKRTKDLQYASFSVRGIQATKAIVTANLLFKGPGNVWYRNKKLFTSFPAHLFAINFTTNTRYLKKTIPTYLNIEKSLHMLNSENVNGLFEVDTFPYFANNYYLNLTSYEFDKHSFIIGASGSGKSKLISLFVDRLQKTSLSMNYRVVVIDPHASLIDDFQGMPNSKVITFGEQSTELFASAGADISAATELTATLFKSLLLDQYTARLDRMLRFTLFVLFTAQNMSLDTLKRFLTEIELRNQILGHVDGYVPKNIVKFFGSDFNEIRTQYYNEAILPIVSLVDEMQLQPGLVGEGDVPLARTINENFLTLFSLNKVSMGEKVVKTVAGLIIQQIFLLAQSHAFNEKIILIIDEVSVVQNPALASILSEARKYNLFVFLTQQYFGQIEPELQASIFTNVSNYYVFRVSEEDARALEGNLKMELPQDMSAEQNEQQKASGVREQDMRVRMLTELHPRECLVRVLANGQLNPCIKARTLDAPVHSQRPPEADAPLQAYPQTTAPKMPRRFVETDDVPATPTAQSPMPPISPAQAPPVSDPQPQLTSTRGLNLMEVLAERSSSRAKVNHRKN
jgi:hypothetical protein